MAEIHGMCPDRFGPVREALGASLDADDVGASVAVHVDGEPVVDIWRGYADAARTVPWERDTITNTWSTTKTMTALCALILADRGDLDLDAPVARYWPEFAAAGKQDVRVRHLMSHTAGLPTWDEPMTVEDLYDWDLATGRAWPRRPRAGHRARRPAITRSPRDSWSGRSREGHHRDHRMPVGRGADAPAARPVRGGQEGRRRVPRHLRQRELLRRDHGPRARHRAPHHGRPASGSRKSSTCRSSRPTTSTTRTPHDAKSHAALLCVQSGSTLDDPNRFKFDADEFYLKSAAADAAAVPRLPGGVRQHARHRRALRRAVQHRGQLHAALPGARGRDRADLVRQGGREGPRTSATRTASPDEVRKQADYEIGVISQMGFPGYFLVVADFINWSKRNGIRVGPGRGSGAGSMAAYAMRITDLDPLRHGLIFERFLNPDRVSMPDFDVDFDDRRRGEVIKYVTEKYGEERVAQIVTYGTIKAKQALKDSSRVLGFPFGMGEKLTKAMPPPVMGKDIPLTGIFDKEHPRYKEAVDIRAVVETDPEAKTVFDTALGLENLKRQWGVHAAGVIMSSDPLIDIIPIMKREQDGQIVTQFDYPACESLGLIKMDFLGLRNLTIINDALDNIEANRGENAGARRPRARRPGRLRAALARRHARRVPARRRPDALAAAADEAGQLRGHLGPHRAVPPGPHGRELAHQLRAAQERPPGDHADPPRARRAARRDPLHQLRPDHLPGAGDGDRAEGRRLLARPGRHPAPRDGQEEEVGARQAVRGLRRRACRPTATRWTPSTSSGRSCSRSPTTRSTKPTPPPTA